MRLPRGAASLAQRLGQSSPCKRILGVSMAELRVLVAVGSCQLAEHGYPSAKAIQQVTGIGKTNLPSELAAVGLLESIRVWRCEAGYRLTVRAWQLLGIERPQEAA